MIRPSLCRENHRSGIIAKTKCPSNQLRNGFGDQGRIIFFLQVLDLRGFHPRFFKMAHQPFPYLSPFFSFAQVKVRDGLRCLLEPNRVTILIVTLDDFFLMSAMFCHVLRFTSEGRIGLARKIALGWSQLAKITSIRQFDLDCIAPIRFAGIIDQRVRVL